MPLDNWGTPLRDVLTEADVRLSVGDINAKLQAFLSSENIEYARPYVELIKKAGGEISPNRLETYKKLFEDLGLIYVQDSKIHLAELGHVLLQGLSAAVSSVNDQNVKLASASVAVLGRHQLLNPTTLNRDYPINCDVLPYRAIWLAMSQLGNLHWEELNRVILRVMRADELDAAIEKIKVARGKDGYDPQVKTDLNVILGLPVHGDDDQAARRITPWFSAAGFGGLLIDREPTAGRRSFTTLGKQVIERELLIERAWQDFGDDRSSWFAFLNEAVDHTQTPAGVDVLESPRLKCEISDDDLIYLEVVRLLDEDASSGVLFVGPPGTGKSWYARQIAIKLCDGRRESIREVQFHPAYQYEDFVEGYIPLPEGGFKLVDKHVLEMAAVVRTNNQKAVLVIDELTRTDPARVMGEVLTYMERTLRGVEFRLPSGRPASLPDQLIFLATANLEDRSVDELDSAMERRWSKIFLTPNVAHVASFLKNNGMAEVYVRAICLLFQNLQDFLPIGHAYFRNVKSVEAMVRLWERQLDYQIERRYRYEPERLIDARTHWATCKVILSQNPSTNPATSEATA